MMKAWKAFHTERERVEMSPDACSWEKLKEYQKKRFEMDVVWLDFLRTKFRFPFDDTQKKRQNMGILERLIPLSPLESMYQDEPNRFRCPLNGFLTKIATFWQNNHFFDMGSS
jgi:hypothetical protein